MARSAQVDGEVVSQARSAGREVSAATEGTDSMNGITHHNAALAAEAGLPKKPPTSMIQSPLAMANGVHDSPIANGMDSKADGQTKGFKEVFDKLPPDVQHVTTNLFPVGMLIDRQLQECWNGLLELVNELAEMPMAPSQPNGINGRVIQQSEKPYGDQSEWNLQKKDKLLNWAQDQRALFIKLLVIFNWSTRTMPDIHKAIDMWNWLIQQRAHFDFVCDRMGYLRRDLVYMQVPSPDLKTAAEVLATGKVASFSDLGYIQRKPVSAKKVLKTLRYMNNLLCSRLTLQQDIPPGFQAYRVHDGRVTFTVPSELELDLSLADEEPDSQFYFVAFRFLFSPCSNIPEGRLLNEIMARANEVLKVDGLQGCYDFLHDLVLSYKVNIVFKQALEMAQGQWSEQLRVELIHRTLVVQYWRNRPSGKSWIEIGVKSGRRKHSSKRSKGPDLSFLDLRWMRDGKEVDSEEVYFDDIQLSMQGILRSVIALHASHLLESIYDKLLEHRLYADGQLSLEVLSSAYDPADCSLAMQLTKTRILTVKMEPITGNLVLQPASQGLMREEVALNRSKAQIEDAANRLALLRCIIADQDVLTMAISAGWEILHSFKASQAELRQLFPKGTLKQSFLKLTCWDSQWMIAVTHTMNGDSWWLVDSSTGPIKAELLDSQPLHYAATLSYSYFTALGEFVSGVIASKVNRRTVQDRGIGFKTELPHQFNGTVQMAKLTLDVPTSADRSRSGHQMNEQIQHHVTVKMVGLDQATGKAHFQAQLRCAMRAEAQQLLMSHGSSRLRSNFSNGIFALEYVSSPTQPIVLRVLDDLQRVDRLITYSGILSAQSNIVVAHISLSSFAIIYHQNPQARLLLKFPTNASQTEAQTPVVLSLNNGNPHERIKHHLHHILSNTMRSSAINLSAVLRILRITYPLLSIFSSIQSHSDPTIQAQSGSFARFHVLSATPMQYTLHFVAPCPELDLSIYHVHKRGKDLWSFRIVKANSKQPQSPESIEIKQKISKAVFALPEPGDDPSPSPWLPMHHGAIVDVMNETGIKGLLSQLLAVVGEYTGISFKSGNSRQMPMRMQQLQCRPRMHVPPKMLIKLDRPRRSRRNERTRTSSHSIKSGKGQRFLFGRLLNTIATF